MSDLLIAEAPKRNIYGGFVKFRVKRLSIEANFYVRKSNKRKVAIGNYGVQFLYPSCFLKISCIVKKSIPIRANCTSRDALKT
jgi:hypothetical protein